ncbi:MAG: DUF2911 domain-containing protein [Bacteroidota bacterium]
MKFLKWFLIVIAALVLLVVFVGIPYMREQTKKHSPQKTSSYKQDGLDLSVAYSSPFKKGRVIFGDLVPYGAVWRTGANEPSTFTTATEIKLVDKVLPAGKYSLWTIPQKEQWTVMFNSEIPDWGVTITSGGTETPYDPTYDAVRITAPVASIPMEQESFLIDFEKAEHLSLILSWDRTQVKIPINLKP